MILTKYSDANIVVVSNRKTKIENLDKAKKVFAQANANITGVVINRASVKDNSYYSYYSNEYYGESPKKKKKKKKIMKDLHSHILFGIDDGSNDISESISLLKRC